MSVTTRCRLHAALWLLLAVVLMRLSYRVEPPHHWKLCLLAGFFAASAAGLLLRVAWAYYALVTYLAYRIALFAVRIVLKLLGRYAGRHTIWQLLRLWLQHSIVVLDLLDREMTAEFRDARPDPRDHAICVAALVAPLIAGWLR